VAPWALFLIACGSLTACNGDAASPNNAVYLTRFDDLWQRFDATYCYFEYKGIDWDAARAEYRPRAIAARSQNELVAVVEDMLAPLRDVHINLYGPDGSALPTYRPDRPVNWDRGTAEAYAAKGWYQAPGRPLAWGRYGDVGYLFIGSWISGEVSAEAVDVGLDSLLDTRALIIDVRPNGGGNDSIALMVAGRFTDTTVIGGYVRFRDGPGHSDFGAAIAKTVKPRAGWRYDKPVFLLVGRAVFSSNEQFVAAMREIPTVRVLGDTTGGGNGNPGVYAMGDGWRYSVPRWIAYTAEMQVIEWSGIPPDEVVPWTTADFDRHADPVLDRALEEATAVADTVAGR